MSLNLNMDYKKLNPTPNPWLFYQIWVWVEFGSKKLNPNPFQIYWAWIRFEYDSNHRHDYSMLSNIWDNMKNLPWDFSQYHLAFLKFKNITYLHYFCYLCNKILKNPRLSFCLFYWITILLNHFVYSKKYHNLKTNL